MATRKKAKEKTYVERWRVDIIETERGWGSKVDESKYFKSRKRADTFVEKYNSKNTELMTPAWYMYATAPFKAMVEETE